MTDDSKIVLRWEIDNARAKFATGRVESEVFDEGGFNWTLITEKRCDQDRTNFALRCDAGHKRQWKCEAEVEVRHYDAISDYDESCPPEHFSFNANNDSWTFESDWYWSEMTDDDYYIINGKSILEYHINIISSERGEPIVDKIELNLASPNRMSNVILKIGEEKLHVSKELLAVHSPVFETMFFGEFAEKGKEEVEIKDVVYEEFLDLLRFVYLRKSTITDSSVLYLLKLSDQFHLECLLDQAKLHLTYSNSFDVMKKLLVADQYNVVDLKNHCLQSFTNSTELVKKVQDSPECDNFSADMKAAIFDRIKNLKP